MNAKRKLRWTRNIYKEAGKLLEESENFLVTKRGYDYAYGGKEISEEEIKSLIEDLDKHREEIKKDSNRWITLLDQKIKELKNHVEK